MSVINDMLRDLEQRKAAGRDGLSHAGALPVVQAASPSSLRNWLLALLVVLLALGLGVWFWQMSPAPTVTEAVAAVAAPSIETEKTEVARVEPAKPEPVPVAEPVAAPVEQPVTPPEPVIKAAPAPEPVVAEEKLVVEEKQTVEEKPVVAEKPPVAETQVVEEIPEVAQQPEPSTEIQQEAQAEIQTEPTDMPVVELAPEKVVVQEAPKPVVTLTPQAQDQKLAAEAQALLRRGDVDSALRQLNQFIEQAEIDARSRAVLVNYLLQYGRLAEAGDVLLGAPVDKDPDLRQLKARWLAIGGRPHEAVSLLESNKPELAAFPDYHALLASYYQQLGQAEPAAGVYAELLKFNPAQANWWAGHALALDRLERYDDAKKAYERALALPGLSGQLAQFAKQRLESL